MVNLNLKLSSVAFYPWEFSPLHVCCPVLVSIHFPGRSWRSADPSSLDERHLGAAALKCMNVNMQRGLPICYFASDCEIQIEKAAYSINRNIMLQITYLSCCSGLLLTPHCSQLVLHPICITWYLKRKVRMKGVGCYNNSKAFPLHRREKCKLFHSSGDAAALNYPMIQLL